MLPKLPRIDPTRCGAWLGSSIQAIRDRIYAQRLLSSRTIKITETDRGQLVERIGGGGGASGTLALGFAVTHTGASVDIAAGKVLTQAWSGATGNNFRPSNWTAESNFTGAVLSSAATAVWIKVEFSESDQESEGALGLADIAMNGGAGGTGGGGEGGGASRGDTGTTYLDGGGGGAEDGALGGDGGLGGGCYNVSDDLRVSDTLAGQGGDGGTGGVGGDGAAGTSTTFTRPTKAVMQLRHYTLSSISAHTAKGTASELATWIKIATVSGTSVTQHHIGPIRLTPAVFTFLEP